MKPVGLGSLLPHEPKLDDDTWDAVDKAAPLLDQRFAAWMKK
ncbi:hypothetical protein [Archangium violaceum]|nr:hypothetical protein [Archangium violaceum]